MMEIIDTTYDMRHNPVDFFRLKSTESKSPASVGNMTRAVDSLARFAGGADLSFDDLDVDFLGEWAARQFYEGYYAKTVAYNISKIAALYNKAVEEGQALPNDAFPTILAKINAASSRFDGINHAGVFRCLQTICRADCTADSDRQLAKDIILFGIFNGGMTLQQIAAFKKDEYAGENPQIAKIIERYARPKNKYLFPLHQARTTPKKLMRSMQASVGALLESSGMRPVRATDTILADLWCDVAMNCGAAASEIAACVSGTGACNALTFCIAPSEIGPDRISEIRGQVIEALTDNPVRWYAMHLRRNTKFKDLTDRLKEKNIVLDEIFYPMQEIFHKVGKKKFFENSPVISWLVFFRTRATQLNRLFHEIGDIAWGYRYLRDVRSPYAVISDREIRDYQHAIGVLGPGTKMLSDDQVQFNNGDYLVILGGPMNGRHGVFIAEKKGRGDASGRGIFRISLVGGNNVNWEVNWDSRLVKKISGEQYEDLDRQLQESLKEADDAQRGQPQQIPNP